MFIIQWLLLVMGTLKFGPLETCLLNDSQYNCIYLKYFEGRTGRWWMVSEGWKSVTVLCKWRNVSKCLWTAIVLNTQRGRSASWLLWSYSVISSVSGLRELSQLRGLHKHFHLLPAGSLTNGGVFWEHLKVYTVNKRMVFLPKLSALLDLSYLRLIHPSNQLMSAVPPTGRIIVVAGGGLGGTVTPFLCKSIS